MKKITNLAVKTGVSATDNPKRLTFDAITESVSRNEKGTITGSSKIRHSVGIGPGESVIGPDHGVIYFSATGTLAVQGIDYVQTSPDPEPARSEGEAAVEAAKMTIDPNKPAEEVVDP